MSSEPERRRLPFEPKKNRKKPAKNRPAVQPDAEKNQKQTPAARQQVAIPEVVSRRMVSRMAIFCGLPTALGILTFIVSYFVVKNDVIELPTTAVLLTSLGFFGLGVLGLSYGVISASWDEEIPGSLLGWREFMTNVGRIREATREAREKNKGERE
ncbi:MAG: PAM68 family protein [Oscillatoriaceae bacterium SKW80]|nr:PAM68 family protein [Oscillatoriaceae bacterium SKYG93]MCX8122035.1 PAM68 family protein [Oscillatoriaceae bacterium SKW80]MDW8454322.1 PAM68 family protein [Oscillatoriaceae cyanobacterium SKYGB_i_bin93]HIK29186.1 PAM68 family protein [Oscillatoriaceae cyanobacterium M7585_C2015_266]